MKSSLNLDKWWEGVYNRNLPGFYPSVEPHIDETVNSWTRHLKDQAGTLVNIWKANGEQNHPLALFKKQWLCQTINLLIYINNSF